MPVAVITGGAGYVGLRLGRQLLSIGFQVRLFDVRLPTAAAPGTKRPDEQQQQQQQQLPEYGGYRSRERYEAEVPAGAEFVVGDIRVLEDVERLLRGADVVFHIASYGMSGAEALQTQRIQQVNVLGTQHIINACVTQGVQYLVYTSTVNAVFGGSTIQGGDESLPYVDPDQFWDTYSRTKAQAEQLVLAANGTTLGRQRHGTGADVPGGSGGPDGAAARPTTAPVLRTCAIRPAGIYGPGECRHLPRIVSMVRAGLFHFLFDVPGSLTDWLHVENLVQALVLAAQGLGPDKGHIAAGQAYFISDNQPINNFEFFRPIITGLGYTYPTHRLPYRFIFYVGWVLELVHQVLKALGIQFTPPLNRSEVNKCAVTHWFRIDKAMQQLGYQPVAVPIEETVAWFRERGYGASASTAAGRTLMTRPLALVALSLCLVLGMAVGMQWILGGKF